MPTAQAGPWGWCLDRLYALKAPVSRPEVQYVAYGEAQIPVPVGVPAEKFSEWLRAVAQTQPPYEALVVFGSRTHFSYGYLPEPSSDLDVLVFPGDHSARDIAEALRRHSFMLPCPVSVKRQYDNFQAAISKREFQFPASEEAERRFFFRAQRRAHFSLFPRDERLEFRDLLYQSNPYITSSEREQWDRGGFSLFVPALVPLSIGKEAIVFLRPGPETAGQVETLKRAGFKNIFVMAPDP